MLRFAVLLLPAFLLAQSIHKPANRKLLVIAVDGLDEKFFSEPPSRVRIPNIRRLMRQGAASSGVIGVAPSNTWPSDFSLITGVTPSEHGILADGMAGSALKTTSLLQAASKSGLKTAAVMWPLTTAARASFEFPETAAIERGQSLQFDDVARRATPAGIVERVESASPGFEKTLWDDASSTTAAVFLLQAEKPDLMIVQLSDVETEQTDSGAVSLYARQALENDDELIGQMLAKVPRGTVIALVSGHGLENSNYIVRPRVLLKEPGKPASAVQLEVEDGLIGTADRATAERMRKLMGDGRRHGIEREVPMAEVRDKAPALARWIAAFDTPSNYVASNEDHGPALGPGSHLAVAGQWPTHPGYRSVLIIFGEGIAARSLGEVDLLQIAPTLADIVGLKLPQTRRRSLWPAVAR